MKEVMQEKEGRRERSGWEMEGRENRIGKGKDKSEEGKKSEEVKKCRGGGKGMGEE